MYVIDNGEKYAMTWLGKLFLLLLSAGCLAQAATPIRFVDASGIHHNPNNRYFIQLIDEAMAVTTSKYGAYELQPVDIDISQSRQLKELEKGTFDLYWTMATPAREYQLQSIPIALSKGSYGIRLLVVRKVDMPQLAWETVFSPRETTPLTWATLVVILMLYLFGGAMLMLSMMATVKPSRTRTARKGEIDLQRRSARTGEMH